MTEATQTVQLTLKWESYIVGILAEYYKKLQEMVLI